MMKNTAQPNVIKVAVLALEGIMPFHLSVPCLVFGNRYGEPDVPKFELLVCAIDKGPVSNPAGFSILPEHDLSALESADMVIVPAWHEDCREAPLILLDALRKAHRRGTRIVGLCLGVFPIAEAGLLNGRTATTHWAYADALSERYPEIEINRELLYVDAGDVVTSAGVVAGLDCCLHLLRQVSGAETANQVARAFVTAPRRQGGQAEFIERPVPPTGGDGRFAQILEWVAQNLGQAHSIDSLAERAAMSRRHFSRLFRQAAGTSFKQWLLGQRLAHAQRMLEGGNASIEEVAQEAGFGSALSLRQHFHRAFHTSPSAYRKMFRLIASS
ncbi:GlxA family transcriptional regulator [Methylococcus capsulatus]|uniref:GlxA family transcriptional regulator n=1 Tax=Methylococcus capsulatus TaxID=414 RepID=UPI001C52AE7B|nr:helix-turn-helix domain-containing protein [Methylococcus capsulatus]QXP89599.1 helix-turn-helix domain-containing protein [Methylococcus capsulatus]